jgi:hypothetical protein
LARLVIVRMSPLHSLLSSVSLAISCSVSLSFSNLFIVFLLLSNVTVINQNIISHKLGLINGKKEALVCQFNENAGFVDNQI